MSTMKLPELDREERREFNRFFLRSAFVSLFRVVVAAKKKRSGGFTYQQLSDALGIDKSGVSRWFSSEPNWEIDTIADIADALELDLHIAARERSTGMVFLPSGKVSDGVSGAMTVTTGGYISPASPTLTTAAGGSSALSSVPVPYEVAA